MGFFSRKSTKTNESDAVADSGNSSISNSSNNNTIGDVRSSPSYTPPPEGGGGGGDMPQPSSVPPPQPVGYKMDPAGDGSEYLNADLVTPETATATDGESVPADDNEGQDVTRPANLEAADATAADDDKEAALPQKVPFDGVKGVVQTPKYKDLKYFIFFVLHFGITIWWFVDSFIPVSTTML